MSEPRPRPSRTEREEAEVRPGLDAWAAFPADRQPRPLILFNDTVQPGGFPNGETKLALHYGLVTGGPDFPAPVLQALRDAAPDSPSPVEVPPLFLTEATPGEREFGTDRGLRLLPAWCVRARDVPKPIWVLDPDTFRQSWQPPGRGPDWRTEAATVAADGRTVTLSFTGAHEHFTSYPGARVLEAGNAVALIPLRTQLGPPGPRTLAGYRREATVTLDRPLGPRVLLDQRGNPVMVTLLS